MSRKAYVVEAYIPNGGTFMAYHVARIMCLDMGYEVRVLTDNPDLVHGHAHGVFSYDLVFPCSPLADAARLLGDRDVLLCNPSFSHLNFGLSVRGMKIMYVQGFSTFTLLDRFFDHYVSVSGFVRDAMRTTYGLDMPVIPPFIQTNSPAFRRENAAPNWSDRRPFSLTLHSKGNASRQALLLSRLRAILNTKDRDLEEAIDWNGLVSRTQAPQKDLVADIARSRYLLTLSVDEGFGLVPLEAMSQGTVVMGFDGYGGREYMHSGINCAVTSYPDLPGVADHMIRVMRDPVYAQTLAAQGMLTAAMYNYESFRTAWLRELARVLS